VCHPNWEILAPQPWLKAKLHIPHLRYELVSHPRQIARLAQGLSNLLESIERGVGQATQSKENLMRIIVLVLLIVAAHFSLIPFAPTSAGKAWFMWPFAADSKSWLGFVGGLPRQSGSVVTPLLAGLAGLGLLAAALGLFGVLAQHWSVALLRGA